MPNCPRCLKSFPTSGGVTQHLQQPRSRCHDSNYRYQLVVPRIRSPSPAHEHTPSPPRSPSLGPSFAFPSAEDPLEHWQGLDPAPDGDIQMEHVPVPQPHNSRGWVVDYYQGAGAVYGAGETFLSMFDQDQYADRRVQNAHYPFANSDDWSHADFLLGSGLSMRAIDKYLSLPLVKTLPLSFWTAQELRSRAESLPSGPRWTYRLISTTHATKEPVYFYYRDALNCIKSLFNNPLFKNHMDYVPHRIYTDAEHTVRVYTEWMSSDGCWEMQASLPVGATLCGVILSSDKTHITNMCGGKVAHPVLISLANIGMKVRNKASSHAFLLLALMPIPEFLHDTPQMRSVLEAHLYHQCMDIVLEPLKQAAKYGCMMPDPLGDLRYCFTPMAAFIGDTPEVCLFSCVRGQTSPVTVATSKNFGDPYQHELRTAAMTLHQLSLISHLAADIEVFFKACEPFRLNGVELPCWRGYADPSKCLTPEALHYWHRQCWDHDVRWCRCALGDAEIDFRFSLLPPITGLRHFHHGITKLKQVGGRTQRDVQRYLVAVIAGGVDPKVVRAIRALMEFRYLSQAPAITSRVRDRIRDALNDFHEHKQAILDCGLRRGQNTVLDHFNIPKLELMQHVVPSIAQVGSLLQWSADTTEHAHIEVVKDPAAMTNNQDYSGQICRVLDRDEKCRLFKTAVLLRTIQTDTKVDGEKDDDGSDDDNDDGMDDNNVLQDLWSAKRKSTDFFKIAARGTTLAFPPRTTVAGLTAIRLNVEPKFRRVLIDKVAHQFELPDLRAALGDYVKREGEMHPLNQFHSFGMRQAPTDVKLPFTELQVWWKVRVQQKAYYYPEETSSSFTLNAHPPNRDWKYGRYDAGILQVDEAYQWPMSGLQGHSVVLVRLIMCPASPKNTRIPWANHPLVYAQRLDIVPQRGGPTEAATGLHVLRRAKRASGTDFGDVFPLDQLKSYAHITPRFGVVADNHLTHSNSIFMSESFFLNKYFDKDFFYAVSEAV